jgi:protein-tyrosine-phosphatase
VLFLCTGNSARSQIAEALTLHRSNGAVDARSAGSHPKPLHPNAIRAMAQRGIDIANHPTTSMARFARTRFDHVVTLCDKVREISPEFLGTPIVTHWSIADPSVPEKKGSATYPAFLNVTNEIETRVDLLLAEL